jgi:hypothetical protein
MSVSIQLEDELEYVEAPDLFGEGEIQGIKSQLGDGEGEITGNAAVFKGGII